MSEGTRKYRHYSIAELDSRFVKISLKLQRDKLTSERRKSLERLLVLIDEERDIRLPPLKEGIT